MTTKNNNLEKKFDLDALLDKINAWLKLIVVPLNYINTFVGFIIGVLHVYIPLPSIPGLIFGILTAASGSVSQAISYGFTHNNAKSTEKIASDEVPESVHPEMRLKHTFKSNLFLACAIPCIGFLGSGAFFGMYTGTIMLSAALSVPFPPAIILTTALTLGAVLAAGTLINAWLQTHNLWVTIRKNETAKLNTAKKEDNTPQPKSGMSLVRPLLSQKPTPKPTMKVDLADSLAQKNSIVESENHEPEITHTPLNDNPAGIFSGLAIKSQRNMDLNPVSVNQHESPKNNAYY